jgi:peptide/nickel transport system ATP-binding protein
MQLLPEGAKCSGSIALSDIEILQADEKTLCNIRGRAVGMVFQEPMTALNPVQTIGQQVAETIRIHQRVSRSGCYGASSKHP